MLFPAEVQAALLFDRRVDCLDQIVHTFARVAQAKFGIPFYVPESKQGVYCRLVGGDSLFITLEYIDAPADLAVFQQTLASTYTGILCRDARERLTRNRSHILIDATHDTLSGVAGDPKIAAMFEQIGRVSPGHSLPQFRQRLDVLGLLARITCDHAPAQLVHWTQSNVLVPGEMFDTLAAEDAPSHLHVHPYLFGKGQGGGGQAEVGIRTFGLRHFIGREVLIEPSILPWAANFETIMAFLRVATTQNGYVIPDGDTFGPEDGSLSYRVLHHDAEEGDVPLCELVPLLHRECGFQADDYVPKNRVIDDRAPPPSLMPADQDEKQQLANEWREKRAMAEGIGGRFEVRARGTAPIPPPPAAGGPPGFGRRPVFGRKGL